ncbi:MAG: Rpn family recombination-promoting nuclease/putative transposase, partial [Desulfovibrio sp.]|nr:Rpn family recombination-promoting nuclease/putative transposase [Desulfovibrio sp.]
VSGSFVSDDLPSRENDVIWKVKWRGADAYLYVMIEASGRGIP